MYDAENRYVQKSINCNKNTLYYEWQRVFYIRKGLELYGSSPFAICTYFSICTFLSYVLVLY